MGRQTAELLHPLTACNLVLAAVIFKLQADCRFFKVTMDQSNKAAGMVEEARVLRVLFIVEISF